LALFFLFPFLISGQKYCPIAPIVPIDRRSDKTKLTIASFNTEWLFLTGEGKSDCPGSGCPWKNETTAVAHLKTIAKVLTDINADIVNIVEVQNCNVLTKLNQQIPHLKYLPYLVQGTDTATGQNVGILTRVDPIEDIKRTTNRVEYPISGSKCGSTNKGTSAVSKHYYTRFKVEGLSKPLAMIGLHFLAFPDDKSRCVQREAQATVIKQLSKELKDSYIVVLGDMNDFDPDIVDASEDVPISQVLNILKGTELTNVAMKIQDVSQRYSCWYDRNANCQNDEGELTMIDHLLISKDLPFVDSHYYHGYPPSCNTLDSDHWPVLATIDIKKMSLSLNHTIV